MEYKEQPKIRPLKFHGFDINNPPGRGLRIMVKTASGMVAVGESSRWPDDNTFNLYPIGCFGQDFEWDFEPSEIVEWADLSGI